MDADEHDGRARDNRRADAQEDARGDEGDEDFKQCADGRGAEQCAVAARTGQRVAFIVGGAEAVFVHLRKDTSDDGDNVEGDADYGDEAGA